MFVIDVPNLNLDEIYDSNIQQLNWMKMRDGKYIVIDGEKFVKVEQTQKNKGTQFLFDCPYEDFYSYWFNYFNLSYDYDKILATIKDLDLSDCFKYYKNVRIMNQNQYESVMLSVLCDTLPPLACRNATKTFISNYGEITKHSVHEGVQLHLAMFPCPSKVLSHGDELKQKYKNAKKLLFVADMFNEGWLDCSDGKLVDYNMLKIVLENNGLLAKSCVFGRHEQSLCYNDAYTDYLSKKYFDCTSEELNDYYFDGDLYGAIKQQSMLYKYSKLDGEKYDFTGGKKWE